jgi:pimeloyl-ACP methyl ester carboxylesterase
MASSALLLLLLAQAPNGLETWLNSEAEKRFAERDQAIASIDSKVKVILRSARARLGLPLQGIPAKASLKAKVTGRFQRDGYTVENLTFESLPGFVVSANLYLPKQRSGKVPAILGVAGHSINGKANGTYQKAWIGFVRRGWAVLAYDPPGQGERLEYFDATLGKSAVGPGVPEHNMAGLQCLLTGRPLAQYFVQDGIRAIDYLLTRPEIDPERIGVAGNSGGGTQAAYLAAVEPRLRAAVSSCYMTSWKQLWKSPGPQDAEQILPGLLERGFDFADFAYAHPTRPFLITSAIQDYFPIKGARDAHAEMKRLSSLLDLPTKFGFFEYDDTHGWSQPRREAAVRWFSRWFDGRETDGVEAPSETEEDKALQVSVKGLVTVKSVADLNRGHAAELRKKWQAPTQKALMRVLQMPADPPVSVIRSVRSDPNFEVLSLESVVAGPKSGGYSYDYQLAARAWLLGTSVPGIETAAALRKIRELAKQGKKVWLHAKGSMVPVAVFLAALEPSIERVALDGGIRTYQEVVDAKIHSGQALAIVPGILEQFDLPELKKLSKAQFTEGAPDWL